MNPEKTQSCPPEEIPPDVPPPTFPPSDGSGTTSAVSLLDFVFNGEEDTAKGFNGGRLVQHSMPLEGSTRTYVFSLHSGPHVLRTLAELTVEVLRGPCKVTIDSGSPQTFESGTSTIVPLGSRFTLETTKKAVLYVTSPGDPGLGGGGPRNDSTIR